MALKVEEDHMHDNTTLVVLSLSEEMFNSLAREARLYYKMRSDLSVVYPYNIKNAVSEYSLLIINKYFTQSII
jgi:hypothetical protein